MKRTLFFKILIGCSVVALCLVLIVVLAYFSVSWIANDKIYTNADDIPAREVGMVLGTGPTTLTGKPNSFFYNRIDAAEQLYKAGKVKFILVSGDNSRKDYSEPDVMRDTLVVRGVPAEVIYLDYAGFSTLESVVRAKKIFGQDTLTVISQRFHNQRSIVLGKWQGMDIIGYNAKGTKSTAHNIRARVREGLARVKMYLDIILNTQPKYLGEPIPIGEGLIQEDVNQ